MIIKLLILALYLGVFPLLTGCLWLGQKGEDAGNVVLAYLYGLMTMLAVFQLLAIPLCFRKAHLSTLSRMYGVVAAVLAAASLLRNRSFASQRRWIKQQLKRVTPLMGVALLCMLLQAGYVTQMQHIDADDAYYLATAVTAVEQDGLYTHNPNTGGKMNEMGYVRYMLASWPILIGMLSQVSGMHATVLAHMALPAVTLFWLYLVCAAFGAWLFAGDKKRQGCFLLFSVTVMTFSGYSIYSGQVFALIRGWQGKAVLAGMGLMLVLYQALRAGEDPFWSRRWLMLGVICGGVSAFTTIGDVFCPVLVGSAALTFTVQKKQWRYLVCGVLACVPNLILGGIYLLRMRGMI